MKLSTILRHASAVIAAILILLVAGWREWSFTQLIVNMLILFAVVFVGGTALMFVVSRLSSRQIIRVRTHHQRIEAGDAQGLIGDLEARRGKPGWQVGDALALAIAYAHLGDGPRSDALASEIVAQLERKGTHKHWNPTARWLYDFAAITQAEAWLCLGRFHDAAEIVRARVPTTIHANFLTALTAWLYYLGGEDYNARVALAHIKPPPRWRHQPNWLDPMVSLLAAYLQHTLVGTISLRIPPDAQRYVDKLAAEAARNAHNPYGERLGAVVPDMQALLDQRHGQAPASSESG